MPESVTRPPRSRAVKPRVTPEGEALTTEGETEGTTEPRGRKPGTFTSESAREARSRVGQAHKAKPTDDDIDRALRSKAAKGDVAAARELRERARSAPPADDSIGYVALEEMGSEALERLRVRLLRMAARMEARSRRAQGVETSSIESIAARLEGEAPPRASESRV